MDFGRLHLLLVHFPIALAIAAVLAEILHLIFNREFFRNAGTFCILFAAGSVIPTALTGLDLIDDMHIPDELAATANWHQILGITTAVLLLAAAALRLVWSRSPLKGRRFAVYGVLLLLILVAISITGHLGGVLAFGKDYLNP